MLSCGANYYDSFTLNDRICFTVLDFRYLILDIDPISKRAYSDFTCFLLCFLRVFLQLLSYIFCIN